MELFASSEITGWLAMSASVFIIVMVLFAKFIKFLLKTAIIAVMLLTIIYFLQQLGFAPSL